MSGTYNDQCILLGKLISSYWLLENLDTVSILLDTTQLTVETNKIALLSHAKVLVFKNYSNKSLTS